MVNFINLDSVIPRPILSLPSKRKDLVPLIVIVQLFVMQVVVQAMQHYGEDIRRQGRISRKIDRRQAVRQHEIRASQLSNDYQRVEGVNHSGSPLPTSLYLGHRLMLSTPA